MMKKIVIGVLLFTVIAAGGTALAYNITPQEKEVAADGPELLGNNQGITDEEANAQNVQNAQGEPNLMMENAAGDPWKETGIITEIDDYGFTFEIQDGESVYIELGPPDYWRNQGVDLQAGQSAIVEGTINDGMIHAYQLMLSDGQVLQLRTEAGQPKWSGGIDNGQGQNAGQADGDHVPEPQSQVDEWITFEGTLMSFQGGNMTISTKNGEIVSFQTGQPRFFAGQGVTFNVGDEIIVVGFYDGEQFMAGDVTQVTTGMQVMLRDPNGRPLWAGPGNGNSNGGDGNNGNGGNGNGGNH